MAFNVITTVNLDMASPNAIIVNAVQYDSSGRVVKANLLNNGIPWTVPSNCYPVIRYRKSDRIGGFYDTDENGAYAISFENDRKTINVTLALQVLTTAGNVDAQINFYNTSGQRVTTFAFRIKVQATVVPDSNIVSSEYYNALTATLQQVAQAGNIMELTNRAETAATNAEAAASTAASEVMQTLPTQVATWLSANMTNPSNPAIDKSLSVSGAAADAKSAGDFLRTIDNALSKYDVPIVSPRLISYPNSNWSSATTRKSINTFTAWEFPVSENTAYTITGLLVGNVGGAPIYFLDNNNAEISHIQDLQNTSPYAHTVITPSGCTKIRYSSYTNNAWDKPPIEHVNAKVSSEETVSNNSFAIQNLQSNVGNCKFEIQSVPAYTIVNGAVGGNVHNKVVLQSQDYYRRTFISATPGEKYIVKIRRTQPNTTYYVVFVDKDDYVISKELPYEPTDNFTYKNIVTVPYGAVGFYCFYYGNSSYDSSFIIKKIVYYNSLQSQIDYERERLNRLAENSLSNNNYSCAIPVEKNANKHWDSDGRTLIDTELNTAHQFYAKPSTKYRITGLLVGSGTQYAIYFLNANNKILASLNNVTLEQYHVDVVTPPDCAIVRYTSYTSSVWDKKPREFIETRWIPSYYDDYWPQKIEEINQKTQITNGLCFAFITDIHLPYNMGNSLYMLKDILNKTSVPFIIFGGDIPEAYGNETSLLNSGKQFLNWINYIGADKFISVRGNHDYTIKTDSSMTSRAPNTGVTLPAQYTYNNIFRKQERYVYSGNPDNMCWYVDIPIQKTRIIGINSCDRQLTDRTASWGVNYYISQKQINWLLNDVLNKDNYNFVIVSHLSSDPNITGYHSSQDIIQAITEAVNNNRNLNYSRDGVTAVKDFSSFSSKVIFHLCGHGHMDASNMLNNVLSIMTTCDACYADDGFGANEGTLTEHAFDIFCVDYDARKIETVRVGRGNNRSWTY